MMLWRIMCACLVSSVLHAVDCGMAMASSTAADQAPRANAALEADQAWQALTSGPSRPVRKAGESTLQYFMREVELAAIHRRERGLRFWEQFPEDERRYRWLLLTVHLPPHYALDMDDWTRRETRLEPNAAALDDDARAEWDRVYPALRRAFMEAGQVTPAQKRFLWFGELRQKALRHREAVARMPDTLAGNSAQILDHQSPGFHALLGDLQAQFRGLLDEALKFAGAWPAELSSSDDAVFAWTYWELVRCMVRTASLLQLQPMEKHAFSSRLFDTLRAAGFTPRPGTIYLNPTFVAHAEDEIHYFPAAMRESEQLWELLPERPRNQADSLEEHIVRMHDHMVAARKYRDIGLRLWQTAPDRGRQLRWLIDTQQHFTPFYFDSFEEGLRMVAGESGRRSTIDRRARAEWDAIYPQLREQVLADTRPDDPWPGRLRHAEVFAQYMDVNTLIDAGEWVPAHEGAAALRPLLDNVQQLYTHYNNAYGTWAMTVMLLSNAGKFGLDEQARLEFTAPMLDYKDEGLRALAGGQHRLSQLRQTPLQLAGTTMDGEMFDLADLRGKVVYLDFWSTGCSSCLPPKPALHDLYLKYRGRGFEVVSVCVDALRQRKKVERIREEMGLTWRTLAADDQAQELMRRFGYVGFPNYMLLDREGRLVSADREEIGRPHAQEGARRLEALLQRLLNLPEGSASSWPGG